MTNGLDEFKQLQQEHSNFKDRALRINASVENAGQNAERFREAAQTRFNVSTPEELDEIIEKIEQENLNKVAEYKTAVSNLRNSVLTKEEMIKKINSENK